MSAFADLLIMLASIVSLWWGAVFQVAQLYYWW